MLHVGDIVLGTDCTYKTREVCRRPPRTQQVLASHSAHSLSSPSCLPVSVIAGQEIPQTGQLCLCCDSVGQGSLLHGADGSFRLWHWWVAWLGGAGWPQARTLPGAGASWTGMGGAAGAVFTVTAWQSIPKCQEHFLWGRSIPPVSLFPPY